MDKTIFLIFVLIFVLTFSSAEEIIWKFNSSEDFFDSNYSSEYYMVDSDNDNLIIQSGLKNAGFNNLWVANAGEGTISKINTKTNTLVAKYRTGPWQLLLSLSPSRTAVDGEGNVWVGNRFGDMNVIKIAADEENCIDKNGNGVIDTSKGPKEVKPSDNNGPQDECILFYVNYWGGGNVLDAGPRAIAIDLNGKVWVGIHSTSTYYKLNSEDGSLNATVVQQNNLYPGMARPYGAVIDGNGILWSLNNFDGNVIVINTVTNKQIKKIDNSERLWDYYLYGITVSKSNKIYLGASFWYAYENIRGYAYIENNKFIFVPRTTFDPDDNMNFWGRGVTFDNDGYLWIAGHSGNTGWLDTNGRVYKINPLTNRMVCKADIVGNAVGVVVDSDYNLWTIVNTEEGRVYKLDKNCNILTSIVSGNRPYTYSDATGAMLQQFISKGWWKVTIYSNDGNPIDWSNISWTAENPIKGAINLTLIFSENQGTLSFFNQSVFGRRNFSQDLTGYLSNNLTIYIKLEKGKDAGDLSPILSNLIIRAKKSDIQMNKYCGYVVYHGY
ncbi:MAG: hypothetical protein Q8N88_04775 [Nanoarchaeota archaeon]|nr:hypothetical protein [Nanoarchaeota archaeon]